MAINPSLKYTLSSLKQTEKEIIANYKKALAAIRIQLLKLDGKAGSVDEVLKYKRYQTLQDNINNELKAMSRSNYKLINDNRKDVFENTFIAELAALGITWNIISKPYVEKILNKPISGMTFKETMKDITRDGLKKISSTIMQGLNQGNGLSVIAGDLKDTINTNAKKTISAGRTETLRTMSDGQEEAFETAEDKGYRVAKIWRNKQDDRVRGNPTGMYPNSEADHWSMEGVEADENGFFYVPLKSGGYQQTVGPHASGNPAVDFGCRCSIDIIRIEE